MIAEEDTFLGCEVDHVISEKHGGPTEADNLANACVFCNRAKGSDIASINWQSEAIVRFFNPRTDRWAEHFELVEDRIEGRTVIGIVTARIFEFNSAERALERQILRAIQRYPTEAAARRIWPVLP
ncbi:MAG TPA: HNH endonuclease signature motif containing protein [Pirellulales bacterium]|nr:HNH endonuclease signature motif containing protein [Pirellulales bacterium]